jgi:outer membrane lipoprotein-sorting protein
MKRLVFSLSQATLVEKRLWLKTYVMKLLLKRPSGRDVFRTDESGTIELITDGERVWVRTER